MCLGLKRDGARGALPSAPGNTGAHAGSGRVSVVSVLLSGSVSLHRSWGPQTTARGSDNISGGSEDRSHSLGWARSQWPVCPGLLPRQGSFSGAVITELRPQRREGASLEKARRLSQEACKASKEAPG